MSPLQISLTDDPVAVPIIHVRVRRMASAHGGDAVSARLVIKVSLAAEDAIRSEHDRGREAQRDEHVGGKGPRRVEE